MNQNDYCDDDALTDYVWTHYQDLFTQLESLGALALNDEQYSNSGEAQSVSSLMRERWCHENRPQLFEALSEGGSVFRTRVRNRLLHQHADLIVINRCPACSKIVRTPRAKQCLWCDYDWHETSHATDSLIPTIRSKSRG